MWAHMVPAWATPERRGPARAPPENREKKYVFVSLRFSLKINVFHQTRWLFDLLVSLLGGAHRIYARLQSTMKVDSKSAIWTQSVKIRCNV